MSKVTRRQQMNPVVGVAEAMMERRRRQRSSFSQVILGESNEEEGKGRKPCGCWVEARGELRENFNTESNRKEDEGEREKSNA